MSPVLDDVVDVNVSRAMGLTAWARFARHSRHVTRAGGLERWPSPTTIGGEPPHAKFLGDVLNGTTAVHVLVRLLWRRKSCVWWNFAVFFLTRLACRASLGSLHSYAKPVFGENGEVLDGGEPLNGGLTEYYQDLIYVGAFWLGAGFRLVLVDDARRAWRCDVHGRHEASHSLYDDRPRAEDDGEREETRERRRKRERANARKATATSDEREVCQLRRCTVLQYDAPFRFRCRAILGCRAA